MFYHALVGKGGDTPAGDLLWTNPNPNINLEKTEIAGDYSKYKYILAKAKYSISNNFTTEAIISKKSGSYTSGIYFFTTDVQTNVRPIDFTDTLIKIEVSYKISGNSTEIENSNCIITEIYGIK